LKKLCSHGRGARASIDSEYNEDEFPTLVACDAGSLGEGRSACAGFPEGAGGNACASRAWKGNARWSGLSAFLSVEFGIPKKGRWSSVAGRSEIRSDQKQRLARTRKPDD